MIFDWQPASVGDLATVVAGLSGGRRPAVVAVNGHSSSGKTSLSGRLAGILPSAAVLHTDDLAWHHGVFSWDDLLLADVLPVVRSGHALRYRPPAWSERGREGEISLPGGLQFLIVEGVGASQRSVRPQVDVAVWVETREPTRLARDSVRVGAGEISPEDYASWMAEENAHLTADQPWLAADLIVNGDDRADADAGVVWLVSAGRG